MKIRLAFLGDGIEKDFIIAEHYLLKAAQHGFTPAKLALGELYYHQGEFVKAMQWYLKR